MTVSVQLDAVKFQAASSGTGDFVVSTVSTGYQSVATADVRKDAVRITTNEIAREHDALAVRRIVRPNRIRTEHRRSRGSITPVAGGHGRPTLHELTHFVHVARRQIVAQHHDLGAGYRAADRIRMFVDQLGRQVRRAERLRETVHQEQLRVRMRASQLPHAVDWYSPAGVRHRT